jgi:hypothetical protein
MRLVCVAWCVTAASCGGGDSAQVDAAVDAVASDGDAGMCPGSVLFTGDLVDWDSGTGPDFLGVFGAVFATRDNPSRTATTAPNGRVRLCVDRSGGPVVLDVDLPVDAQHTYLDALVVMQDAVLAEPEANRLFSGRGLSVERALTFYGEHGLSLDPQKAQLLVAGAVDISASAQIDHTAEAVLTSGDGQLWTSGADDRFVLFANVEVGDGATELVLSSSTPGQGTVVLEAGKFTYTLYSFHLE